MSNEAVSMLYAGIINSVIGMSEMDFEDSGLSKADAYRLRAEWQEKLSSFKVGLFPWEHNYKEELLKKEASALCRSAPPTASVLDNAYNEIIQTNGGQIPNRFIKKEEVEEQPMRSITTPAPAVDAREVLAARITIESIQRANPTAVIPLDMLRRAGMLGNTAATTVPEVPPPTSLAALEPTIGLLSPAPSGRTDRAASTTETVSEQGSDTPAPAPTPAVTTREEADKLLLSHAGVFPDDSEGTGTSASPDPDDLDDPALDDDNDGDDLDYDDVDYEFQKTIICEYEKVHRSKGRWKGIFRNGIMNINGKDYVFRRAHGEMDW